MNLREALGVIAWFTLLVLCVGSAIVFVAWLAHKLGL